MLGGHQVRQSGLVMLPLTGTVLQSARLWSQTVSLFLNKEVEELSDIYIQAANLRPEMTTRLSGSSPLRNISDIKAEVELDIGATSRTKLTYLCISQ